MQIMVTGATGFLGGHVVEFLRQQNIDVIALGRNTHKGEQLKAEKVTFHVIELTDYQSFSERFERVDSIIHCAALSSDWGTKQAFIQANVVATENILRLAKKLKVKSFVHVSSTSVYFNYQHRLNINEASPLAKQFANYYAESKYLAEQRVLAYAKQGLNACIIRPRGIIGEGDPSILPKLLGLIKNQRIPIINHGETLTDLTYVKNVAYALYLAANKKQHSGEIYNISNHEPKTTAALYGDLFKAMRLDVTLRAIPYGLANQYAKLCECSAKLGLCTRPKLTRYSLGLLAYSQTLTINKAQQQLGYKPLVSLEEGFERYAKWAS